MIRIQSEYINCTMCKTIRLGGKGAGLYNHLINHFYINYNSHVVMCILDTPPAFDRDTLLTLLINES